MKGLKDEFGTERNITLDLLFFLIYEYIAFFLQSVCQLKSRF